MKRIFTLVAVLLAAGNTLLFAQTGRSSAPLQIRLTDNTPVSVSMNGQNYTNEGGMLSINNVAAGSHEVSVFRGTFREGAKVPFLKTFTVRTAAQGSTICVVDPVTGAVDIRTVGGQTSGTTNSIGSRRLGDGGDKGRLANTNFVGEELGDLGNRNNGSNGNGRSNGDGRANTTGQAGTGNANNHTGNGGTGGQGNNNGRGTGNTSGQGNAGGTSGQGNTGSRPDNGGYGNGNGTNSGQGTGYGNNNGTGANQNNNNNTGTSGSQYGNRDNRGDYPNGNGQTNGSGQNNGYNNGYNNQGNTGNGGYGNGQNNGYNNGYNGGNNGSQGGYGNQYGGQSNGNNRDDRNWGNQGRGTGRYNDRNDDRGGRYNDRNDQQNEDEAQEPPLVLLTAKNIADIKKKVAKKTTDAAKNTLMQAEIGDRAFTAEQARGMLRLMKGEASRLSFARWAIDAIIDVENFAKLATEFKLAASKREIKKLAADAQQD